MWVRVDDGLPHMRCLWHVVRRTALETVALLPDMMGEFARAQEKMGGS